MNSKNEFKIYLESIRCPHCGIPTGYVEFPENGEIPCYNCGNPVLKPEFLNEDDKLYFEKLEKQEQGKFYKKVEKENNFEEKDNKLFIKGKEVIKGWEASADGSGLQQKSPMNTLITGLFRDLRKNGATGTSGN